MPEKINELNIQKTKEAIPGDEEQSREGPEITAGEELDKVATDISEIKDKIEHDQPITEKNILELKESINDLTINIGGEEVSINEIKNIKDLKRNLEIFKEIEAGNFDNYKELTFITSKIAEGLNKHKGELYLNGLTSLSDNAAESLSKHEEELFLFSLISLSDNAVESLSKHKGALWLPGLISLSDNAAESLSKHKGWFYVSEDIKQQINKFKT